jgi:dTDP-4-amino-4,6-dideoxygalactose transaminase
MNVPLLDLKAQYQQIKPEIEKAIAELFESQLFILGPAVQACEQSIAAYCACPHAVGVSSGTDALLIALMCEGLQAGDEVILPAMTFASTAEVVLYFNAKPILADTLQGSNLIDTSKIGKKISNKVHS